jgi:hypothetical protein
MMVVAMSTLVLCLVVLLPAVPGTLAVARAFRRKDRRLAKLGIRWAFVTALTAFVIVAVSYLRVAAASDGDFIHTRQRLEASLDVTQTAVRLGMGLAGVIGFLGGVARGLAPEPNERER